MGVAYLAGHKQLTTSSIYIRPELHSAEKTLGLTPSNAEGEALKAELEKKSQEMALGKRQALASEVAEGGMNAVESDAMLTLSGPDGRPRVQMDGRFLSQLFGANVRGKPLETGDKTKKPHLAVGL